MIPLINFTMAAEHLAGWHAGSIVRFGAILKDAASGQIVGHLQETGVMQTLLSGAATLSPPPFNALFMGLNTATGLISAGASGYGVHQNRTILTKMAEMQQTLGAVHGLGVATLVSSVAGLGATAISTALLLRRIDGVADQVRGLGDRIDALPEIMRADRLNETLDTIRHELRRLSEVGHRPESGQRVAEAAEARLDDSFRVLVSGVRQTAGVRFIDPELLRLILAGMMVSSDAVATVRLRSDGPAAAQKGAEWHYSEFESAIAVLPPDVIRAKLAPIPDLTLAEQTVRLLTADVREVRARMASRPMLHETLALRGISGPAYLEMVAAEQNEPFLLLAPESRSVQN